MRLLVPIELHLLWTEWVLKKARLFLQGWLQGQSQVIYRSNNGIRKHLLEYDEVMNQQRQVVYDIRNQALSEIICVILFIRY